MNAKLRDLNVAVRATDERQIEVIASGLPVYGGAQLAVDVTLRSVLSREGEAKPKTHWLDGAVAEGARGDKESTYPELTTSGRCRLVVLALETGGRFSAETMEFLRQLAAAKALSVTPLLRASSAAAFQRRWVRMLAVSAVSSFTNSLLLGKEGFVFSDMRVARQPWLQHLLTESRQDEFWAPPSADAH